MDKYPDYSELKKSETEGKDYIIRSRNIQSCIAVLAPHGGGIEPGTLDIADQIAGNDFSFYAFTGLKNSGNSDLHIDSTHYNEPVCLEITEDASTVLTVHGCRDEKEVVYIGGRHLELKLKLSFALKNTGFNIIDCKDKNLKGSSEKNICNRGKSKKGVQLEISIGLRRKMFPDMQSGCSRKSAAFYQFTDSIRSVLLDENKKLNSPENED